MTTFLIILLLIVCAAAVLAFVTLPAAVKAAVETSLSAHLDNLPQEAASAVAAAHKELSQLELDAKDIVDKARSNLSGSGPTS